RRRRQGGRSAGQAGAGNAVLRGGAYELRGVQRYRARRDRLWLARRGRGVAPAVTDANVSPMHRVWIVALLIAARAIDAQCADGSPPPCVTRRATPPASVRARHFLLLPFKNVTRKSDQEWLVAGSQL